MLRSSLWKQSPSMRLIKAPCLDTSFTRTDKCENTMMKRFSQKGNRSVWENVFTCRGNSFTLSKLLTPARYWYLTWFLAQFKNYNSCAFLTTFLDLLLNRYSKPWLVINAVFHRPVSLDVTYKYEQDRHEINRITEKWARIEKKIRLTYFMEDFWSEQHVSYLTS